MRKAFHFFILAMTATIASVSCAKEMDGPDHQEGSFTGICITPVVDGQAVKATTEAGDDTYNENLISNYCWFIYSDAEGTTPLLCGQETGSSPRTLVLDSILPSGGTAYVYVIANLPAPYTLDTDNGIVNSSTSDVIGKTLSAIKAMGFDSAFYNYTSATTGLPAPANFVMRTVGPVAFTLVTNTTVDVTADLKRVAAKIVLDLKVAEEVKQMTTTAAGAELYKKTWLADIGHIQIYMLWGSTHADIAGTKLDYKTAADPASWFYSASPRYAMYTNPDGGSYNASTNTVEGSVPSTRYSQQEIPVESSVWQLVYQVNVDSNGEPIWNWRSGVSEGDKTDEHIGNLTYGDWDFILDGEGNKIPVVDAEGNYQYKLGSTTVNRMYYLISSLPMYSMPIQWNVNDAHAPFIKVILPWQGCIKDNDGDGAITSTDPKTTEFYYKILVPERTTLDANGCYHISLDLSVLGSEADEVPVELYSEYHVVDWNASEAMGGIQSAGRYLDCNTYFEFYSQDSINIPVSSSHDIEVVGTPTAVYTDLHTTTPAAANLAVGDFTITTSGNSRVTVSHHLENSLSAMSNEDISPIEYTFTIQHVGDGGSAYQKTITVVQYPSIYASAIENTDNGDILITTYFTSERKDGNVYINNQIFGYPDGLSSSDRWKVLCGIPTSSIGSSTGNNNPNKYRISSSILDSSLGFIIGDPRTDVVDNPSYTFESASAIDGSTRTLTYYYPTDHDPSNEAQSRTYNMVAPSFINASSFGKCGPSLTYDEAVRRCAAYQEDGYPAGRWRVPSKAEIQYVSTLSSHSLIPQLYNNTTDIGVGTHYWSAHGVIQSDNEGNVTLFPAYVSRTIDVNKNTFELDDDDNTQYKYDGGFSSEISIRISDWTEKYNNAIDASYNGSIKFTPKGGTTEITRILIKWFSSSWAADATTVTGGGTVSYSSSDATTTWTGSTDAALTFNFARSGSSTSDVSIKQIEIDYHANPTSGFVRCVYDDWYWGKERAVDIRTFTWGDQQR